MKIIGNVVGTTLPKPNFKQTDPTKGDYIKEKPVLGALSEKDIVDRDNLTQDIQEAVAKADTAVSYAEQELSEEQKEVARANIGAASEAALEDVIENKADKSDIVSADWNASAGNPGHIENRTHWIEDDGETVHQLDDKFIPDTIARNADVDIKFASYEFITVADVDEIWGVSIQNAGEVII